MTQAYIIPEPTDRDIAQCLGANLVSGLDGAVGAERLDTRE